jgi:hypothetical protein
MRFGTWVWGGPAIIGIAILTACGSAPVASESDRAQSSTRNDMSRSTSMLQQDALLAEIVGGLRDSRLFDIRIGPPPEPFESPGSVWLSYTIDAEDQLDFLRGYWQALLVSGLFSERSAELGLPRLHGHAFTMRLRDGSLKPDSAGVIVRHHTGPTEPADAARLRALIRDGAVQVGLSLDQIQFTTPSGRLAPEIVATTSDPVAFLKNRHDRIWSLVRPVSRGDDRPRAEGSYVEVRDEAGDLVTISVYAARIAQGGSAVAPQYVPDAPDTSWGTMSSPK